MNKEFKQRLFLESSFPGTLALLLENDIADAKKALAKIIKNVGGRKTKLSSLINSLPSGGYKDVLTNDFQEMLEPLTKVEEMIKKLSDDGADEAQAKEIGILLDQTKDTSTNISLLLKINQGAMSYMAKQIMSSQLHKGDDKDTALSQIFKEADLLDQAKKEFSAAIKQTINDNPLKKANKGFFASLADEIFGSSTSALDIAKESQDALFDGILELTPLEVGNFALEMVNYGKEDAAANKQIEDEVNDANKDIKDDAGGPADEDEDEAEGGTTISKKALLDKAKEVAGEAGTLVIQRMIATGVFDNDLGITLGESLKARSLNTLMEITISGEDYQALLGLANEEQGAEEIFKDIDTNDLAVKLNKVFADQEIELEIEKTPPKWDDLDAKAKRRAFLGFYLDGDFFYGGPASVDTFNTLLSSAERAGYEGEDIEDMDVDFNRTFARQDGVGAPKMKDVPDFVNLVNKAAENDEKYSKFKIGASEDKEDLKVMKDDDMDAYLVPFDHAERLKKAGFDLEESRKLTRLRKLAGIR